MFCKNCGNELKEGVKFCSKCGTPVGVIQSSENQEVPQAVVSPDKNAIIGKSYIFKESLIKSCASDAQSDFSPDCTEISQAYWRMSRN